LFTPRPRRHPSSTLFPYTTLFRSNEVVGALDKRIADVSGVINARGAQLAHSIGAKIDDIDRTLGVKAMEVADNLDARISRFEDLDRKSTRLNSSHVSISYAVFCLK